MSEVDVLLDRCNDTNVAYTRFLSEFSPKLCFAFVEGKNDPSYYRCHINREIPRSKNVIVYPAGNKQKVKELYGYFDWNNYNKNQIIFLMDRDYSDIIEDANIISQSNVYVTDHYSIENDIFTSETLDSVMRDSGFANCKQEILNNIKDLYDEQKQLFERKFKLVIVYSAIWREKAICANLNNFEIGKLFEIREGKFICSLNDDEIKTKFHIQCINDDSDWEISESDKMRVHEYLRSDHDLDHNFRGKYLEPFFLKFCNSVIDDRIALKIEPPHRIRKLNPGDVMSLIAPRSRPAESFLNFVHQTVVAYFQSKVSA